MALNDKGSAPAPQREAISRPGFAAAHGPWLWPTLLLVLAVLVVVGFVFGVVRGKADELLVPGLAALSMVAALTFVAGRVVGRSAGQVHGVAEVLADATGDAMVIADDKGRALHANTAFVQLASRAGKARLVSMDVLYSGYPDFAEPVYQLAQAARAGQAARSQRNWRKDSW